MPPVLILDTNVLIDELVLEAAVACGAGWIVTHNVRDLAAGAIRFGIEVLTPGEALRRLGVGNE